MKVVSQVKKKCPKQDIANSFTYENLAKKEKKVKI